MFGKSYLATLDPRGTFGKQPSASGIRIHSKLNMVDMNMLLIYCKKLKKLIIKLFRYNLLLLLIKCKKELWITQWIVILPIQLIL